MPMAIPMVTRTLGTMNTSALPAPIDPRFWMLLSPALPIGGYSFSHGLESTVAAGLIDDASTAHQWIRSLSFRVLPTLELPLLSRLLDCINRGDRDSFVDWNDYVLASRESAELLTEETAKGQALNRLLSVLEVDPLVELDTPSFSASFAQVCSAWRIDTEQALTGYSWVWFETLVTAAVKLVPLGHSDGQRMLLEFTRDLPELIRQAHSCTDDDLGAGTHGLAMLSAEHEHQHGRVFRS